MAPVLKQGTTGLWLTAGPNLKLLAMTVGISAIRGLPVHVAVPMPAWPDMNLSATGTASTYAIDTLQAATFDKAKFKYRSPMQAKFGIGSRCARGYVRKAACAISWGQEPARA